MFVNICVCEKESLNILNSQQLVGILWLDRRFSLKMYCVALQITNNLLLFFFWMTSCSKTVTKTESMSYVWQSNQQNCTVYGRKIKWVVFPVFFFFIRTNKWDLSTFDVTPQKVFKNCLFASNFCQCAIYNKGVDLLLATSQPVCHVLLLALYLHFCSIH